MVRRGLSLRIKKLALKRIQYLLNLAIERTLLNDEELAQRYAELAKKIAMRHRVKIPREYKRLYCKKCKAFICPGVSARVRLRQERAPHLAITCLKCGAVNRYPYYLEKKLKRRLRLEQQQ